MRSPMVIALAALLTAFAVPVMAADTCATTDLVEAQGELGAPEGRIYLVKPGDGTPRSAVIYQHRGSWLIAYGNAIFVEGTAIKLQGGGLRCDSLASAEDWLRQHVVVTPSSVTRSRKKVAVAPVCRLDPVLTAMVKDHPHPFSEGHRGEIGVVARGGPWLASVDAKGSWTLAVGIYYDRRGVDADKAPERAPPILILSARQVYTCPTQSAAASLYGAEVVKARARPLQAGSLYKTQEEQ